jgi:hypothetical protein
MASGVDGTNRVYHFGGGDLYLGGEEIGEVQNVTINLGYETAKLYSGTSAWPKYLRSARGTGTGTAEFAIITPKAFAALFGTSVEGSGVVYVKDESQTITGGAVTLDNAYLTSPSGNVNVIYQNTADGTYQQLQQVLGTPAAGQFQLNDTNTIAFHTDDNGKAVDISYFYSSASAVGVHIEESTFPPQLDMLFTALVGDTSAGTEDSYRTFIARNCRITGMEMGATNDVDYRINSVTFEFAAYSDGKVLSMYDQHSA